MGIEREQAQTAIRFEEQEERLVEALSKDLPDPLLRTHPVAQPQPLAPSDDRLAQPHERCWLRVCGPLPDDADDEREAREEDRQGLPARALRFFSRAEALKME